MPSTRRAAPTGRDDELIVAGPGEALTRSDVDMLRAATGVNFDWPPAKDGGVPEAVARVALARAAEGPKVDAFDLIKRISSAGIRTEGRVPFSHDFMVRAAEYLTRASTGSDSAASFLREHTTGRVFYA